MARFPGWQMGSEVGSWRRQRHALTWDSPPPLSPLWGLVGGNSRPETELREGMEITYHLGNLGVLITRTISNKYLKGYPNNLTFLVSSMGQQRTACGQIRPGADFYKHWSTAMPSAYVPTAAASVLCQYRGVGGWAMGGAVQPLIEERKVLLFEEMNQYRQSKTPN